MDRFTEQLIAESAIPKSVAEQNFDREKEEEKKLRYPKKSFGNAAPIPAKMLHCALFRVADKRVSREERIEMTIAISSGGRIEYKGAELRQAEASVFAYLCHLNADKIAGCVIGFDPKEATKAIGWADSKYSIERFAACLDAMVGNVLKFYDKEGKHKWTTGLLYAWKRLDNGNFEVKLSEELMAGAWESVSSTTQLNLEKIAALPEGLATWLYGFVSANNCRYPFTLEQIKLHSGSRTAENREFGKQVRFALDKLEVAGVIQRYTTKKGEVAIFK